MNIQIFCLSRGLYSENHQNHEKFKLYECKTKTMLSQKYDPSKFLNGKFLIFKHYRFPIKLNEKLETKCNTILK